MVYVNVPVSRRGPRECNRHAAGDVGHLIDLHFHLLQVSFYISKDNYTTDTTIFLHSGSCKQYFSCSPSSHNLYIYLYFGTTVIVDHLPPLFFLLLPNFSVVFGYPFSWFCSPFFPVATPLSLLAGFMYSWGPINTKPLYYVHTQSSTSGIILYPLTRKWNRQPSRNVENITILQLTTVLFTEVHTIRYSDIFITITLFVQNIDT